MRATIQKWGNSLALRIPKTFAAEAGVEYGSLVELTIEPEGLFIRPVRHTPNLDELLEGITPENLHGEVDTGGAVGREGLA